MSRVSLFSSPLLLGFDGVEQLIEQAAKLSSDGYPPYNIERLAPRADGSLLFRISVAVAGFGREELEITIADRQLVIRGKQKDDETKAFLYRGIAARHFAKSFVLADGLEVWNATLENGLLSIDLVKSAPERVVRHIEIK